ncbi:hypothetical protein V408_00352 [Staphylococcus aureus W86059]|nr:hypothetical protein V408_00352 [Staphylococcus aureus W86059]
MNEIETIISEIEKLLTNNTPYSISKNSFLITLSFYL